MMNEILKIIKNRRSIRSYKPEQISQETLDLIIEAAIYAPTAHNQQPWHFTIVQNPQLLEHINQKTREAMARSDNDWARKTGSDPDFYVTYKAPTLIIVSGRKDAMDWHADCSAAIENMLIAAESLNIGSVWLGLMRFYFEQKEELAKLQIPDGYEALYGVALGYKTVEKNPDAPRRNFDVVDYIR